jgi:hypothetical protein
MRKHHHHFPPENQGIFLSDLRRTSKKRDEHEEREGIRGTLVHLQGLKKTSLKARR